MELGRWGTQEPHFFSSCQPAEYCRGHGDKVLLLDQQRERRPQRGGWFYYGDHTESVVIVDTQHVVR